MKRIFIAIAMAASSSAWSACIGGAACGPATRYDVSVQEVSLCSDSACSASVLVGSGAKTFDIASATVGSAIGSYARLDSVAPGVYNYVRVVVSRTFTLSGGAIAGGGGCVAQSAAALSIPNNNPGGLDASLNAAGMYWHDGAKSQLRFIQALPTAIVLSKAGTKPVVSVKFKTQQGLMCLGGAPYPAPPDVTLSVM